MPNIIWMASEPSIEPCTAFNSKALTQSEGARLRAPVEVSLSSLINEFRNFYIFGCAERVTSLVDGS